MSDLQRYFQEKWDAVSATEALYYKHDLTPESIVFDIGGYKGEWQEQAKLEGWVKAKKTGEAPPMTGKGRLPMTDEARQIQQQGEEARRASGVSESVLLRAFLCL